MKTHLLLIDCRDEPGLIHKITGALFRGGFTIMSNREFVDPESRHFFMRTVFSGDDSAMAAVDELRPLLPESSNIRLTAQERHPVVILATKEAHCLGDLLLRQASNDLGATISAVISNHDSLKPLVERFGIPFHHISHQKLDRQAHEQAMLEAIKPYAPQYVILAKYMRVLSPKFLAHYPSRIINIHHSFLPAFAGAKPYHQAYERGVKIIGATAHFVTENLDEGPIIAQDVLPVAHNHTATDMAQAGRDVEKIVLSRAVRLVLEERIFLNQNRTVIFD